MKTNQFIDPAKAEDRNVFCGWCGEPVKGHLPGCPHCQRPFYANMHGYARICKNPTCRKTETAGHAHGLCRMHYLARKQRQAIGATLPKCACGNTCTSGHDDCSRCREAKEAAKFPPRQAWSRIHEDTTERCPHGVKMIFGNVCVECQDEHTEMRRDDARNYESRG